MKKLLLIITLFSICLSGKGQTWSALGSGINGGVFTNSSFVYALDTLNGSLYAGGTFDTAGGVFVNNIAEWNGVSWNAVGGGITSNLNGPHGVYALTTYKGNLYAGGQFDTAGIIPVHNIAEWDGANWASPGSGINWNGQIFAMTEYNGNLYAAGKFDSAGGISANNIAEWNGTNWLSVGAGMNFPVYALAVYNGNLYAGGLFSSSGGITVNRIAEWNGTTWGPISGGTNGTVNALVAYNGNLYVGGTFSAAGGTSTKNIAEWNGSNWASVGSGINLNGEIWALNEYDGNLYVGGTFDSVGSIRANNIAEWNGANWNSMGNGVIAGNGRGMGTSGITYVNTVLGFNGSIYAGGAFDSAGTMAVNNIAKWGTVTGINELSQNNSIKVYPNPSTGIFTFQSSINSAKSSIEVYNMLGEKVYNEALRQAQGDNTINLSGQSAGIYLYRIVSEQGVAIASGKLVIQ